VIDAGAPPATRIVRPVFRCGSYGYGRNAYGEGFPSRTENSRKSDTVPITVIQSFCLFSSSRNRCPTTPVRLGHSRLANTPLTMATPERAIPSASVKSRPVTIGRFNVFNKCGVTPKYATCGS